MLHNPSIIMTIT